MSRTIHHAVTGMGTVWKAACGTSVWRAREDPDIRNVTCKRCLKIGVKDALAACRAANGHSDDCPSRRGGKCVYPCHMQPTGKRTGAR